MIDRMVAGVNRFNDAGLRDRLTFTCHKLSTGITNEEIRAVLATRQGLAHRMSLGRERSEYWDDYRRVLHVADRIVLRLLNYAGPYTNVQTLQSAVLTAKEPR